MYKLKEIKMSDKKKDCKCTNTACFRHGDCKACKAYHEKVGTKTGCERPPAKR